MQLDEILGPKTMQPTRRRNGTARIDSDLRTLAARKKRAVSSRHAMPRLAGLACGVAALGGIDGEIGPCASEQDSEDEHTRKLTLRSLINDHLCLINF